MIKKFIISKFSPVYIWGIALLFSGYLLSRLFQLTLIPIFTDEAIYLRWSQIMAFDWVYKYLPLSDGKPPLFMWLVAIIIKINPLVDPLVLGRLVSVGAGFGGLIGIMFASFQVFQNRKISFLAGLFYVACPFTFFYDRFALADSLLAAWAIWALGLSILLYRTRNFWVAVALSLVCGLGLLTKTPAVFFLLNLVFLAVFIPKKEISANWPKLGIYLIGVVFVSWGLFYLLRFLPEAYLLSAKNEQFALTLGQFLKEPFNLLGGNLKALWHWELSYLTVPVMFLVILPFVEKKNWWPKLSLLTCFGFYLLAMASFNKVIYPRFLLLFTPYLLILAAAGVETLGRVLRLRILVVIMLVVFLLPSGFTLYKLYTDPAAAPIADVDSDQYLNSWPAGYGITEVKKFFKEEAKNSKVTVVTEGTFGLLPYSLELYQREYPNLQIQSYWPPTDEITKNLVASSKDHPTYLIIYQREPNLPKEQVALIAKYRQGYGENFLQIFKINP